MATLGTVITRQSVGPSNPPDISFSNFYVAGQTPWGLDRTYQVCPSFGEFQRLYGGLYKITAVGAGVAADTFDFNENDPDVIQTFYNVKAYFDEKGSNSPGVLYFSRVCQASSPPTAGVRTYTDGAGNLTTITSKWKGAWGNTVFVTITNASPVRGAGWAQIIVEFPYTNAYEVWEIANSTDAADASKKSQLVTISLPGGGQLPQTAARGKLNAGSPGTADAYNAQPSDYVGSTSAANVKTGLQVFNDDRLGTGFVAVPGQYDATTRSGINTHCSLSTGYGRVALLGGPSGLVLNTVTSDISTTGDTVSYWTPQMYASNQATGATTSNVLVDNVGFIAGLAARMARDYGGPHKAPAGMRHTFVSALDVERASNGHELYDNASSNTLADSNINTIRVAPQGGIMSWGLRTRSTDPRYKQFNFAWTVCYVKNSALILMNRHVMEPIDFDGVLFSAIKADLDALMESLWKVGALYGSKPGKEARQTDAWFTVCDLGNNPAAVVGNNEVHVDLAFVPAPNAEKITLNLLVTAPGFIGRGQ